MSSSKRTVAIFGATGGTGLATLKRCLEAGHAVNVLARTPSKLAHLSTQYPNLHIIEGNIHSLSSVKATLIHGDAIVDVIISAIGMVLKRCRMAFTSENSHVCEEGAKAILAAIYEVEREQKVRFPIGGPEMVLLSTTGISDRGRDIPVAMIPLFRWMRSAPHEDKKRMEEVMLRGEGNRRRWVLVRPSLLYDGESKGLKKLRVSIESPCRRMNEKKEEEDVAIGYCVSREDVGLWIVEECVKKDIADWQWTMVTLTN